MANFILARANLPWGWENRNLLPQSPFCRASRALSIYNEYEYKPAEVQIRITTFCLRKEFGGKAAEWWSREDG